MEVQIEEKSGSGKDATPMGGVNCTAKCGWVNGKAKMRPG